MKLSALPFSQIRDGQKSIETRLYDEKRREISIGDTITFSNLENPEGTVSVRVKALLNFETFSDLFNAFPPEAFGGKDKDDLKGIYKYYSKEDEKKWTVLGIVLETI